MQQPSAHPDRCSQQLAERRGVQSGRSKVGLYFARTAAAFFALLPLADAINPNAWIRSAALWPSARNCATVKREYLWSIICQRNFGGTVTTCAPARAAS